MTKTRWIIFVVICALVLIGLIALNKSHSVDVSSINAAEVIKTGKHPDHVRGDANSKVVLVEYGDFQCPICGSVYQPLKDALAPYIAQNKIAYVFRNFPLTSIHPNTLAASSAAEAAGLQGKYWQMHDKLYENQDAWAQSDINQRQSYFDSYAKSLGLNIKQFESDMASSEVSNHIRRDKSLGKKIGVSGTPTFVLNGQTLSSSINRQIEQGNTKQLTQQLDQAIKKAGETPLK